MKRSVILEAEVLAHRLYTKPGYAIRDVCLLEEGVTPLARIPAVGLVVVQNTLPGSREMLLWEQLLLTQPQETFQELVYDYFDEPSSPNIALFPVPRLPTAHCPALRHLYAIAKTHGKQYDRLTQLFDAVHTGVLREASTSQR